MTKILKEAVRQAKLAYQFNPSSYTAGCLSACLTALHIAEALAADGEVIEGKQ